MTSDYQTNCGTLTATNGVYSGNASINVGGNISGQTTTGYVWTNPYYTPAQTVSYTYWPTYENTAHAARIAELEGEVKVLREMMAALIGGKKAAPKRRKV